MRPTLAAVVAVAALLAGCGDDDAAPEPKADVVDTTAPKFRDAEAIAKELQQAGFGCRDFKPLDDPQYDQGQCTVEGDVTAYIAHFTGAEQQGEYLAFAEEAGCESLKAQSEPRRFHFVNGNLWTIEPSSDREVVDRILSKIGGTAAVIDCTKPAGSNDSE